MYFAKIKPNMTPERIREILEDHADDITHDADYEEPLSGEVVDETKEELSATMIELMEKEREFSEVKAEWGQLIKDLTTRWHELARILRTKKARRTGTLYTISDPKKKMVYTYDQSGKQIDSFVMPENYQLTINGEEE